MATRSHLKEVERECPVCHETKVFPARNTTCSKTCARAKNKEAVKAPAAEDDPHEAPKEVHEHEGNVWRIDLRGTRIQSLEELIAHYKVDATEWEIVKFKITHSELGAMPRAVGSDATGWIRQGTDPIVTPLTHIKAEFRRKLAVVQIKQDLDILLELARKKMPPPERPLARRGGKKGNLLEVSIPDLHFGGLVWGKETGHANWDVKIATETYRQAVESLISQAASLQFDRVLYVIGNDFVHIDSSKNETTFGTRQDSDTRYKKIYRAALAENIAAIQRLRSIAPVDVMPIPGNHDYETTFHMAIALQFRFEGFKDVTILESPKPRRIYRWGNVLLGFTHSDKEGRTQTKLKSLPSVFSAEFPKEHGATSYREIHTAHYHTRLFTESGGYIVRGLSSLTPPNAWATECGFIGSQRRAESFYWNKHDGPIGSGCFAVN